MKKDLDEKGNVAIYGIYFDTDKATIKKESEAALAEIVKLMNSYPDLRVEIQGHTDNQGNKDHNLKLSKMRADSVKNYLVQKGIDAKRMEASGYGSDKPVASNDTDDGKSKNRRVELKKIR
jgi:outer membrane protein OmpA-like peptidoglycan-associated protein